MFERDLLCGNKDHLRIEEKPGSEGTAAGVTDPTAVPSECVAFHGRTGRGLRVAVIDSGVHAAHPHIAGVAGGVTIGPDQAEENSYVDILGHGTAVMAAIKEKAPAADYFAVRVFHSALRTSVDVLLRAMEWCIEHRMDVINLSLGTSNPNHAGRFASFVSRAGERGVVLVSARDANGIPALPGSLPGVIGVGLDWDWPRESYSCTRTPDGVSFAASGYPRSLPSVPRERNLHGISFAVANMTGFVVRACEGLEDRSHSTLCSALATEAERIANWRKLVGVEPTCDTECPTLVLKTRPSTGQD
jgi:subtilisin family serine protease